jgi:hypothetical protein
LAEGLSGFGINVGRQEEESEESKRYGSDENQNQNNIPSRAKTAVG